jgi:Tfp pilus assembly protein PilF
VSVEKTSDGGLADAIHSFLEIGTPGSLNKALALIWDNELEKGNFGRMMSTVAETLLERLYPDTEFQAFTADPPRTHSYARILRNAEEGIYAPPPDTSQDYLELVLPSLSFLQAPAGTSRRETLLRALSDLERGRNINPRSVLAPYFMGRVYEELGEIPSAIRFYTDAHNLDQECYPAVLGIARILNASGRFEEGIELLSTLEIQYPDNLTVRRQLALAYYNTREFTKAAPVVAEVLRADSRDRQFILMRAAILVEQGQYLQAQQPLELYGSMDPNDRRYLYLRARVQAEGYHNREGALGYLRSALRSFRGNYNTPNREDEDILIYAAELFMESPREEDRTEGRSLLNSLLSAGETSLPVVALALRDAARRRAWNEARPYLNRLLEERRSPDDLLYGYQVEQGLGNNVAALAFAQEVFEQDQRNDEGRLAYVSSLINANRRSDAAWLLENRLSEMPGGLMKSRYYFLRSRLQTGEEGRMNDLRSSLFEDPRNINALTAMFEIYHRRKDQRRAVYYLKQALALDSENSQLQGYAAEYGDLMD